jgi:hypothetical protein
LKDSALRLAASVLEAQPDPPRQVSFMDVLKTRTNVLLVVPLMGVVLVLAGVLRTGSHSRGGPTNYVALGILLSLLLASLGVWVIRDTVKILVALRTGLRMTCPVHTVGPPSRYGQFGSVRVQIGGQVAEKLFSWSGVALEFDDRVQVLVDPDPAKAWVALMLGPAGDSRLPRQERQRWLEVWFGSRA